MKFRALLFCCLLFCCALAVQAQTNAPQYYVPYHIYDVQAKQWIDLETLLAQTAKGDVLFLGEQHNDDDGHKMELTIVQGITRRRGADTVVAMEMFERDTQPAIDDYLAGRINETEFLSRSRPWSNYQPDYRPIVEFLRSNHLKLVASNVPQRLARVVANSGMEVMSRLPESERPYVATQLEAPRDSYWQRFTNTMMAMMGAGSHGASSTATPTEGGNSSTTEANPHANPHSAQVDTTAISERVERFYQAQCLKDETMGESVAKVISAKDAKSFVIHINGSFHSDYAEGTMARARRRLPNARIQNISIVPVDNLDKIAVDEYVSQANYLIFTLHKEEN